MKKLYIVVSLLVAFSMLLAACKTAATEAPAVATEAPAAATEAPAAATEAPAAAENPGLQMESAQVAERFWSDAEYEKSKLLMTMPPLNPDDPIYLQSLEESPTATADYPQYAAFAEKEPPYNVCFSNAGVNNPWRVVGYIDIREQGEELRAKGLVQNFYHLDAQGNDAKQIADIKEI